MPVSLHESAQRWPRHIAVIMDGNGRWAVRKGLARTAGHAEGMKAVRRIIESAAKRGISFMTLYSFSSENWSRPPEEINVLMSLLRQYLKSEVTKLDRQNVRIRIIGDLSVLDSDIVKLINAAEARTQDNTGLCVCVALNYGGRAEIIGAVRNIAESVKAGEVMPEEIGPETFSAHLYTAGVPDPDLLIRTSGEQRISNFLLWQLAYAEFVFLDVLWPDFSDSDLDQALDIYAGRERRFGAVEAGDTA